MRCAIRIGSVALVLLASCATPRRDGALHISATHYQSMVGVQVDTGDDVMTCSRDTITGSHIMRWYCQLARGPRYQFEVPIRFELSAR
jgi:hypothetical protein